MANGTQKKTRQQRVASVELPPGPWGETLVQLQRGSVLLRLGLCFLLAIALWLLTRGWEPPFSVREGDVPHERHHRPGRFQATRQSSN